MGVSYSIASLPVPPSFPPKHTDAHVRTPYFLRVCPRETTIKQNTALASVELNFWTEKTGNMQIQ